MKRYPDEIIILESNDSINPYEQHPWNQVYRGRCRCFLDKEAAFRGGKEMDNIYQVVIPDTKMPDIGENLRVGVRMHTSPADREWTLVGNVRDFARYDRVCNLNFEMVKQNLIEEDIPGYEESSST